MTQKKSPNTRMRIQISRKVTMQPEIQLQRKQMIKRKTMTNSMTKKKSPNRRMRIQISRKVTMQPEIQLQRKQMIKRKTMTNAMTQKKVSEQKDENSNIQESNDAAGNSTSTETDEKEENGDEL